MTINNLIFRGAAASWNGARLADALGNKNVFDHEGNQRSFSQVGDFSGPRRRRDGIIVKTGPDAVYPGFALKLVKLTANLEDAGYTKDPGTTGFLHVLVFVNQSNCADATGGAAEDPDSDPDTGEVFNVLNPDPRIKMFVGGIHPHQDGVKFSTKDTAIDAAQYASVISAYDGKNPEVPRNSTALAMGVQLAAAFPEEDQFLLINRSAGSTTWNQRLGADTRKIYQDIQTLLAAASDYATANNLTMAVVVWTEIGFEAEGYFQGVSNGLTLLAGVRSAVNAICAPYLRDGKPVSIFALQPGNPRSDINHDPESNYPNNPSPDLSNMGKINNVALAMVRYAYGHDENGDDYGDPDFYPFPGYMLTARGPSAVEANAGVHYLAQGHMELGDVFGIAYVKLINGEEVHWPRVTAASRVFTSQTVNATVSESGTFNHDLVTDPYSAAAFDHEGVDYTNNGTAKFSTARSASGTSLTATYTGLTGISERLKIASGNSPKLKAEIISSTPPNIHTAPAYGLGPTLGQRCTWESDEIYGYSLYTGRPHPKRLLHDELPVTVTLEATLLADMLSEMGVTPTMCLDASDPDCYPGTGSTIYDLASGGATYSYYNSGGAISANWSAAAGSVPASFNFNGSQRIQSSGATFMADDHKATGKGVYCFVVDIPSGTFSQAQYLLASNRDNDIGGGIGNAMRLTTSRLFGFSLRGAAGANVYTDNAQGTQNAGKTTIFMGFDTANLVNWFMLNTGMIYVIDPEIVAMTLATTPSSGSAESSPLFGSNAGAAFGSSLLIASGWKIFKACRLPYAAPANYLPLFRSLSAQIGNTVATQEP